MQRETIVRFIERRSDVPNEMRNDPRFEKEVNDLVRILMRWEMLQAIAIHEVGHEKYFRDAGCTDFTYVSPTVGYKEADKEHPFDGQLARIIPIFPQNYPEHKPDNWQFLLAKGYAAGGACARRLTTVDYGGDTRDRRCFKEMCDSWYDGADADQFMDVDAMWKRAQDRVKSELDNSTLLRSQILRLADDVIPTLFPWTKYT